MTSYLVSPVAEGHLDSIWEYIACDNFDAADRWIAKLLDSFGALARSPEMGHSRADLTPLPLLFWPVGRYLVVYRRLDKSIEIVAVVQGGRDVPSLLCSSP